MKKVMILGASIGQLPIIKKAKELGYELAVVDYDDKAVGIPYADKFYHVSTIDEKGVINAAVDFQPDGITTVQTDMPVRAMARACEKLKLPGITPDTALKATDKEKMIEAFKAHDVSSPDFFIIEKEKKIEEFIEKIEYPCIFKPSDNSGSRGVSLVTHRKQVKEALKHSRDNSRNGRVIVEEFMQGPEVSVEVLMKDGKGHVLAVTDKMTTGAPYFVEIGHSEQSQLNKKTVDDIKKLAVNALLAVGVTNGPGHVEIIVTNEGPKLVELGARLGGDFITTDLVPLSTGVDMLGAVLKNACGEDIDSDIVPRFNKGSAIRFIQAEKGRICSVHGIEDAENCKGIVKIELLKHIGDFVPTLQSSLDRTGYVISQADSAKQAMEYCEYALKKIKIDTIKYKDDKRSGGFV